MRALPPSSIRPARARLLLAVAIAIVSAAMVEQARAAAPIALTPHVVTATRTTQPPEHVPFALISIEGDALRANAALTVDGALRTVPGFSLFRRSDSLVANPTAQGVSLRGLGPSGASRSLLLLDGVPLNDPFGGWVPWSMVPRESLRRVELVRGGGATAWGNAALGGVVQLFTEPPTARTQRLAVSLGEFGTHSAELALSDRAGRGAVQVMGRAFTTDGFALVAPERRGSIDIPAASEHAWISGRWQQALSHTMAATISAQTFNEERNNGTPFQRNASRANIGSLTLAGQPRSGFTWTGLGYAQEQNFSSTFSGVNATRSAETPASDQFAVPARAYGLAWTGAWSHARDARTGAGVDARRVRGETRERFTFVNGAFTRLRVAGGTQQIGGVYALHERQLGRDLRATIGGRLDRWEELDGHRREADLASGAASRDEHYPDRTGTEFSPSAGLVWTPDKELRVRLAGQRAFRRPTLNELYRPFRVGPNITETNPLLRTERVTTTEFGFEWRAFGASGHDGGHVPAPFGWMMFGMTAFSNDLRDAVGNVTVARGPGTFPLFGTIAAGGVGRQRLNLDRVRVRGLEVTAAWAPIGALRFDAEYLYNDAAVRSAAVAPALVGRRLAQVPKHSASFSALWRAPGRFVLTPRVRWIGQQFEDDENQLVLGEAVIADLGISRAISREVELFARIENIGDARIETGRTADGVVNLGTPRLASLGLRLVW